MKNICQIIILGAEAVIHWVSLQMKIPWVTKLCLLGICDSKSLLLLNSDCPKTLARLFFPFFEIERIEI